MNERTDDAEAVRQRLLQVIGVHPGPPAARSAPASAPDPAGEPPATSAPPGAGLPAAGRRLPVLGGPSPFDPGRRGVKALAAVAVLVVLGAGFLAWRSRPHPEPVPAGLAASAAPAAPVQAGPSVTGSEMVVAVAGKVRRPGLVRLPPGSRVADAVEAAGGVLPGTDLATVNLARKLTDGELIVVGAPVPPGVPAGGGPAGPAGTGGKVNLNTATLAQLDTLPGVGRVLAQRILDYRTSHGGFRSVSDLRQVDGIGDTRFERLKDLVTV